MVVYKCKVVDYSKVVVYTWKVLHFMFTAPILITVLDTVEVTPFFQFFFCKAAIASLQHKPPIDTLQCKPPIASLQCKPHITSLQCKSIIDSLQCKLPIASWFACFLDVLKYFNPIWIVQANLLYFLWVEFIWEFRRLIWLVARLNLNGRCSGRCYVNSTTFTCVICLVRFQLSGM